MATHARISGKNTLYNNYRRGLLLAGFIVLMVSVAMVGCAGKSAKTEELLSTEYIAMSNDDLQLYFYQLEDQIVADERKTTGSSVSVGVGRGGYGRRGGVGMSTGSTTQVTATELRDRRNEVRLELQNRGITP